MEEISAIQCKESKTTDRGRACSASVLGLWIALAAVSVTVAALYLSILRMNGGTFTYSLDDPYISLAVGEQIRHGHYGTQVFESSAPSSSIVYPFLLAAAPDARIAAMAPFWINSAALLFTIFILHKLAAHLRLFPQGRFGVAAEAAALYLIAIYCNLIAVVFTGLEHSLHVAATAACVYGLARFLDTDKMPYWLPAALIAAPLIRYEGLALDIAALAVLCLRGWWRTACATLTAIAALLASFSGYLVHIGLPPLPSSVLVKSDVVANGIQTAHYGLATAIRGNVHDMLTRPVGTLLLVVMIWAVIYATGEIRRTGGAPAPRVWMSVVLAGTIGGHAAAGRMGGLYRYEDYLLAGTLMAGAYLVQDTIRARLACSGRAMWICTVAAGLLFYRPYAKSITQVPLEANNIYEQQYQMGRFVRDYWRNPVAVNDIGLVSYRNPHYVLDLRGLSSERARKLYNTNAGAREYRELADESGIQLAIVYDEWFTGKIPANWRKVAKMSLSREDISAGRPDVEFYATNSGAVPVLDSELAVFRRSLPPGVELTVY